LPRDATGWPLVKQRFRLRKRNDFERVRRYGRSFAHPLIVLIDHSNELAHSRFGVAAGRAVGKAVERNRAKRRLRAILAPLIPEIVPGVDILLIARKPILEASHARLEGAVKQLLNKAKLFKPSGD
jgi:ribonuclease P protein component